MMQHALSTVLCLALLLGLCSTPAGAQGDPAFEGAWEIVPAKSSQIGLYRSLNVDFTFRGSDITLVQTWGTRRRFSDTLMLALGGTVNRFPITNRVFATNVFMGLSMPVGGERTIIAEWEEGGNVLRLV